MVGCPRCGCSNELTSKFCVACGSPLSAVPVPAPTPGPPAAPPQQHVPAPQQQAPAPQQPPGPPFPSSPAPPPVAAPPFASGGEVPMTSAQSAPQVISDGPQLAYAETAPPLLGEDVLSRKIPDRGTNQPRYSVPDSIDGNQRPSHAGTPPPGAAPADSLTLHVPVDAPRVLMGFLVSYEGNALGQSWSLHQGTNLIGRSGAVAGADLELPHATVSSRHAQLRASAHPGRVLIMDLGSTNGTFVNETPLTAHQKRELRDGDRIRFGLFTTIIKIV